MKKLSLILGISLWSSILSEGRAGDDVLGSLQKLSPSKQAQLLQDSDLLGRALRDLARDPWKPAATEEKLRGPAADVYPVVAPAVVVVKTEKGHGTGAFIDPAGWLITNHHVVAEALTDTATGAGRVTIYMGKLKDGFMVAEKAGVPALVYKSSPDKDLALVRMLNPRALGYPSLKIAESMPAAGKSCVSIGHPGSGVLWTVRSGEITGIGQWPADMTESLTLRLSASPKERGEIQKVLGKVPQRKIVLSSCGINHGDSGGPLVNEKGELIAVSYAMPKKGYEGTIPFAYHVHLDEVKEFLKDRPTAPVSSAPEPWPSGIFHELLDMDNDGTFDTLGLANDTAGAFNGMVFDLRQESNVRTRADLGSHPRSKWRFCFALHLFPRVAAFYDTDLDGKIDLVMSEKEPRGDIHVQKLTNGRWTSEIRSPRPLIDPLQFEDREVRDRLTRILQRLGRKGT